MSRTEGALQAVLTRLRRVDRTRLVCGTIGVSGHDLCEHTQATSHWDRTVETRGSQRATRRCDQTLD
jgi:hypothetical protein